MSIPNAMELAEKAFTAEPLDWFHKGTEQTRHIDAPMAHEEEQWEACEWECLPEWYHERLADHAAAVRDAVLNALIAEADSFRRDAEARNEAMSAWKWGGAADWLHVQKDQKA